MTSTSTSSSTSAAMIRSVSVPPHVQHDIILPPPLSPPQQQPSGGQEVVESETKKVHITQMSKEQHEPTPPTPASVPAAAPAPAPAPIPARITFMCESGELLYGQVHTAVEGSTATDHDTATSDRAGQISGTIITHPLNYRVHAKKGAWHMIPLFMTYCGDTHNNFQTSACSTQIGYVCYHDSVNPIEVTRRAVEMGEQRGGQQPYSNVRYINRYDWGGHHHECPAFQHLATTTPSIQNLNQGQFFVTDANVVNGVINDIVQHPEYHVFCHPGGPRHQWLFQHVVGNQITPVASMVSIPHHFTEYELGWLIFDETGKNVIGLVYDGAYTGLDGGEILIPNFESSESSPSPPLIIFSRAEYMARAQQRADVARREWEQQQAEMEAEDKRVFMSIMDGRGQASIHDMVKRLQDQQFRYITDYLTSDMCAKYPDLSAIDQLLINPQASGNSETQPQIATS